MNKRLLNRVAVPAGAYARVEVGVWRVRVVETQHCRSVVDGWAHHHPARVRNREPPGVIPSGRRDRINRSVVTREQNFLEDSVSQLRLKQGGVKTLTPSPC